MQSEDKEKNQSQRVAGRRRDGEREGDARRR